MIFRVILLLAVGIGIYWLYRKRVNRKAVDDQSGWKYVFLEELPILKNSISPGYYMAVEAMSRSNIDKEACIARLDELLNKMKEDGVDTQPIATLILKIEADENVH